jgi:hypothetical protein
MVIAAVFGGLVVLGGILAGVKSTKQTDFRRYNVLNIR